jgi:hypothetical protein
VSVAAAGGPAASQRRRRWVTGAAVLGFVAGIVGGLNTGATTRSFSSDGSPPCPGADAVRSQVDTSVSRSGRLLQVQSRLDVELTGVVPEAPAGTEWDASDLDALVNCLAPGTARLIALDWTDGKLHAELDLGPATEFGALDARERTELPPVHVRMTSGRGQLSMSLCEAAALRGFLGAPPAICSDTATTTVSATLADLRAGVGAELARQTASPLPAAVSDSEGGTQLTWRTTGPPKPVTVDFEVPLLVTATTFMQSPAAYEHRLVRTDALAVGVDWNFLGFSGAALVALIVGAVVLRRRPREPLRLLTLGSGLVLVGGSTFSVSNAPRLSDLDRAVPVLVGWGLVCAAMAASRMTLAASVVASLAVGTATAAAVLVLVNADPFAAALGPYTEVSLAAVALILFTVLAVGAVAVGVRAAGALFLVSPVGRGDRLDSLTYRMLRAVGLAALIGLACALGYPLGSALADTDRSSHWTADLLREVTGAASSASYAVVELIPVLVAAACIDVLVTRRADLPKALPTAVLTLGVPWSAGGTSHFVVELPLWLLQLAVLHHLLSRWSGPLPTGQVGADRRALLREVRAAAAKDEPAATSSTPASWLPDVPTAQTPRDERRDPTAAGHALLELGPAGSPWENALITARVAAMVAVVPVSYFLWETLGTLGSHLAWSTGALLVLIGLLIEATRWIAAGLALGFLRGRLPGRIGPAQALVLAGAWVASALAPTALARALEVDAAQQLVYRSAQLALFLVVVAVAVDIRTLRAAGGSWRDLQQVYALRGYGEVVAALAPALLLILTLTQQVLAGSGLDVAEAFLGGIGNVLR